MAMKSASAVAQKWSRNLAASTQSIKDGVLAVTVNPAQRALERQDAYVQGVQRAVADGSYRRGLQKVTTASWQKDMIEKGLPRIADGASKATGKFQDFMQKWLQHLEGLKGVLSNMPRGDLQTNIQRMIATVNYNASYKTQQ